MRHVILVVAAIAGCSGPMVPRAGEHALARRGSFSVELVDEVGRVLPTFTHRGRTYVLGTPGQRYLVRVRNGSPDRAEVVVSVDGLDTISGAPAAWRRRGYLVDGHRTLTVDGFRLSEEAVAAFRFSSVARSYAALQGDARDVGVIGVAVFRERERPAPPALAAREPRAEAAPRPGAAPERDAARSSAAGGEPADAARPGLGTAFGEEHASHVRRVPFERAGARPSVVLTLRYDDRAGLLAAGVDVDGRAEEAARREDAEPFRREAGYARPPPGWSPEAWGG